MIQSSKGAMRVITTQFSRIAKSGDLGTLHGYIASDAFAVAAAHLAGPDFVTVCRAYAEQAKHCKLTVVAPGKLRVTWDAARIARFRKVANQFPPVRDDYSRIAHAMRITEGAAKNAYRRYVKLGIGPRPTVKGSTEALSHKLN